MAEEHHRHHAQTTSEVEEHHRQGMQSAGLGGGAGQDPGMLEHGQQLLSGPAER